MSDPAPPSGAKPRMRIMANPRTGDGEFAKKFILNPEFCALHRIARGAFYYRTALQPQRAALSEIQYVFWTELVRAAAVAERGKGGASRQFYRRLRRAYTEIKQGTAPEKASPIEVEATWTGYRWMFRLLRMAGMADATVQDELRSEVERVKPELRDLARQTLEATIEEGQFDIHPVDLLIDDAPDTESLDQLRAELQYVEVDGRAFVPDADTPFPYLLATGLSTRGDRTVSKAVGHVETISLYKFPTLIDLRPNQT